MLPRVPASDGSRFVVMTSIFAPTEAVHLHAQRDPGRVVVAGDRKTPTDWAAEGTIYLSPEAQLDTGWKTPKLLPFDHYCRKMVGYLRAIAEGATSIADIDDDNFPHDPWEFPAFEGRFPELQSGRYFNVYTRFTDEFVWPRGYPLRHVTAPATSEIAESDVRIGVWQALADGDPDVDAIFRLTVGGNITFEAGDPFVLARGTVCPFNSQNTAFTAEAFPLLYLPATVTFRSTDIVRGLVAQPILWAAGMRLGFLGATATQDRNDHDFLDDFRSEIPLYLHTEEILDIAMAETSDERSIEENLRAVYDALAAKGHVEPFELELLDGWLADVAAVREAPLTPR